MALLHNFGNFEFFSWIAEGDVSDPHDFDMNSNGSTFFFSLFFSRQLWDEFSVVKRSHLPGLSLPIFD